MQFLSDPQIWIAFATLTVLELVLGIDNIVFVSILSGRLPAKEQPRARFIGLALALVLMLYRNRSNIDLDAVDSMKG